MKFVGLVNLVIGLALLIVFLLLFVPLLAKVLSGSIYFSQILLYPSLMGQYILFVFGLLYSFVGFRLIYSERSLKSSREQAGLIFLALGVVLIIVFTVFFGAGVLFLLLRLMLAGGD